MSQAGNVSSPLHFGVLVAYEFLYSFLIRMGSKTQWLFREHLT